MMVQDEPRYRHEVFVLGKGKSKLLVNIIDLHTSAEDERTVINLLGYAFLAIMLVLYITEDFFDHILERDHSSCTTQLIDHNSDTLLTLHEELHQRTCLHALRDKDPRDNMPMPISTSEHFTRMNVPNGFINILLIDDDF